MKSIAVVLMLLVLAGTCMFLYSPQDNSNFFEENNIGDEVPVGRDVNGYWLYQTRDKKIVKTKEYPTTPEGISYAKLVEEIE